MAIELSDRRLNIQAGQDLTPIGCLHKAVTINGVIAANPVALGGFLKSKGAQGENVAIADSGVVKVFAGAAVSTVGMPVTVTTSGFVIACPVGSYMIGKAYATAASGDLFPCLIDAANIGAYNG